ncbi:hypothetical protein LXM94_09135 [Rhizobium sp. TRM95111]|uniref:hypothetical protein n=1 Tax=Rhizobium alarense TaxID=2846851 RepID=UPI001F41E9DA|nr:hypothetical protein [Rhizobium alarense]MCF3640131.1 hypothetical protein [Rhizobium alarense]
MTVTPSMLLERKLASLENLLTEKDRLLESLIASIDARGQSELDALRNLVAEQQALIGALSGNGSVTLKALDDGQTSSGERELKVFTGQNGDVFAFSKPFFPPFTIAARIYNVKSAHDDFSMSSTTPPMPFTVGGVALYRRDEETMRLIIGNKEKVEIDFDDNSGWITLHIAMESDKLRVYVNEALAHEGVPPELFHLRSAKVGCGHKDRGWSGYIDYLWIKQDALSPASAKVARADTNLAADKRTIFYFDGAKSAVKA